MGPYRGTTLVAAPGPTPPPATAVYQSLDVDTLVLVGAALLALGAAATGLVQRLRFPAMLASLALGMVLGSDGLGWLPFDDAELSQTLAVIALLVILFEGGLTTSWRELRAVLLPATLLATLGVAITGAVVAGVAMAVLDISATTAALIGAVVASTDAAAVFSAVRGQPIDRRSVRLLEAESGLNDPAAALLTVGVLATWSTDPGPDDWTLFALVQLGGGVAIGLAVGAATAWILRRIDFAAAGLYPVVALSGAGLAYGGAAFVGASGFLATFLTGVVVATRAPRRRPTIALVTDALASTAQIALFLLLGLLVFPSQLPGVAAAAVTVSLALTLVARPLAVATCLAPLGWRPRALALVSWAGLRGAVPIVLATFALTAGYPDGQLIFDVVFFVVVLSTLVQALTVQPVARRLGLLEDRPPPPAIATVLPIDEMATDVIELELTDAAAVVGLPLRDVPTPGDTRVSVVVRGTSSLIPDGDTVLHAGDVLVVAAPARDAEATGAALLSWSGGSGRGEPTANRSPGDPPSEDQPTDDVSHAEPQRPGA